MDLQPRVDVKMSPLKSCVSMGMEEKEVRKVVFSQTGFLAYPHRRDRLSPEGLHQASNTERTQQLLVIRCAKVEKIHSPGIEPGSPAWQVLPLDQLCC